MRMITKIACRTIGVLGLSASLYNASRLCGQFSKNGAQYEQAKYLERRYFDARTIDTINYNDSVIQEKTFDLISRSPIPTFWGKIKGGFQGFMYGLGDSLPTIACSSLALCCKNSLAKLGAIGLGLIGCFKIARHGFGLGKVHPMD
ncbi:MAG: hypothetical protein E7Z92_00670 [Cyanobacteria bacterium SIG31]|nr:hypothetical protein [Cyanobacteria bacterium SIG31]